MIFKVRCEGNRPLQRTHQTCGGIHDDDLSPLAEMPEVLCLDIDRPPVREQDCSNVDVRPRQHRIPKPNRSRILIVRKSGPIKDIIDSDAEVVEIPRSP